MRTYFTIVLAFVFVWLVGSVLSSVVLDPEGAHPATHIDSLRPYRAISDPRKEKYAMLGEGDHQLLLFGSSRTWRGLNPSSVEDRFVSSYNVGVPGTNFSEIPFIVNRALESQTPEAVVFEASLHLFKAGVPRSPQFESTGFNPDRSLESRLVDVFGFLPFERSIRLLWRTLRRTPAVRQTDDNGTLLGFYGPEDFRRRFEISLRYDMNRSERLLDFELDEARVTALFDVVRLARDRGAEVFVVFPPIHALYVEAIREAGAIDDYYTLIRRVVAELGTTEGVQIWDMSAYYPIQQEALPEDSSTPMQNYADPSHFTIPVGDCLLTTIFAVEGSEDTECTAFGTRLNPTNIGEYITRFEQKHHAFCDAHADECAWVRELRQEGAR